MDFQKDFSSLSGGLYGFERSGMFSFHTSYIYVIYKSTPPQKN